MVVSILARITHAGYQEASAQDARQADHRLLRRALEDVTKTSHGRGYTVARKAFPRLRG